MLTVSAKVRAALEDTHVRSRTFGQAQYQGRTALLDVTGEGTLTWQASGEVQARSSVRAFGYGASLIPRSRSDLLAPNGQEVALFREVFLRGDTAVIPLGVYRVTSNDGGRFTSRAGRVLDWEVNVELADRLRMVERAKLVNPKSPVSSSMYEELQRLLLFPLVRSLPDESVPPSMVYEERSTAVRDLCALAGGVPRMTRQGALTIRPADRWLTELVPEFDISGTIDWKDGQSDEFYNTVWAHSDDGEFSALAVLDDASHPLSVDRAGPSTYEHSSPVYTSQDAVAKGAATILDRLLNRRSRQVSVEVGAIGLLLELSDFGWFRDTVNDRAVLGEVSGVRIPNDPTKPIGVDVVVAEEA